MEIRQNYSKIFSVTLILLQNELNYNDPHPDMLFLCISLHNIRSGSRAAATSKMKHFVIIVNGWKPLTIITKTLYLGCCSRSRSASGSSGLNWLFIRKGVWFFNKFEKITCEIRWSANFNFENLCQNFWKISIFCRF